MQIQSTYSSIDIVHPKDEIVKKKSRDGGLLPEEVVHKPRQHAHKFYRSRSEDDSSMLQKASAAAYFQPQDNTEIVFHVLQFYCVNFLRNDPEFVTPYK